VDKGAAMHDVRSRRSRTAAASSFALAFAMLTPPLAAFAQTQSPPTMDDAIAAISAAAPAAMAYQGTPGLSLAITDRTHTVRVLTFGYAEVASKAPVTPATRFAIGSITKSMTALALLGPDRSERADHALSAVVPDRRARQTYPRSPAALAHRRPAGRFFRCKRSAL
jgi:hypothetical protein